MSDDKLMIRRLVLDILKPFDPELHIVATEIINRCKISKEISVNLTVYEVDKLTQTVKIIIEGRNFRIILIMINIYFFFKSKIF